ncbi:MAG: DUF4446 family protein [Clostridia bacterium]|nr:DUF4446 family protein [Clostridia bacterium]
MEKFFEKLSEMMTFENQVYLMVAVMFILLVLCFIMLLVVGIKYKKLNSLVGKMSDGEERELPGEEAAEVKQEEPVPEEAAEDAEDEPVEEPVEEPAEEPEAEEPEEPAEEPAEDAEKAGAGEEPEEEPVSVPEESKKEMDEVLSRISALGAEIAVIKSQNEEVEEKLSNVAAKQRKCFDKIKVVRYNATLPGGETVPGYSIGITNQDSDGVVLTGITAAEGGTSLEVKSIRNGKGNVELTPAEECAVARKTKE